MRRNIRISVRQEYRDLYAEACPVFLPFSVFDQASARQLLGTELGCLAYYGGMDLMEAYALLSNHSGADYTNTSPDEAVCFLRNIADENWPKELQRRLHENDMTAHVALLHLGPCDFCNEPSVWTEYALDNFVHDIMGTHVLQAGGVWNACYVCANYIEHEQWDKLLDRAEASMKSRLGDIPGLRERLQLMHSQVRGHLHKAS